MEEIKQIVSKLGEIRKVPQFIYLDSIGLKGSYTLRKELLKFRHEKRDAQEIDFILNSGGGSAHDAYRIIKLLRNHFATVNVVVPYWAKSAATLLALGAHRVILDDMGELGPLDVQIHKMREDSPDFAKESALTDEHSLKIIETRSRALFHSMFEGTYANAKIPIHRNELAELLFSYISKFYEPLLAQINPFKLGDNKRKLDIAEHYARRILGMFNQNIPEDKKNYLIDYLVNGCPDHEYVIDYELIKRLLPTVCRSADLGPDYELTLAALCDKMIRTGSEITLVGFLSMGESSKSSTGSAERPQKTNAKIKQKAEAKKEKKSS